MQTVKEHWPLILILCAYLIAGTLYAVHTPAWQVPDEPAHYNYIRVLAEERRLPVMEPGDYDQQYLEQLTRERFPPELSIEPVTYEDHQPPLYYLLAVPFYLLFDGELLALRLFSLTLGAVTVGLTGAITLEIFPRKRRLAWLASGGVAFVPQYLGIMAGVNNDALAVALLALWFWLTLRYVRGAARPALVGIILGLLLLTKTTGYIAAPLAVLAALLYREHCGLTWQRMMRQALWLFLPALLLGGLWWTRNLALYGWPDFLGLIRHDAVVMGQPRTADAIAREGLLPFLPSAASTTFRSFWGQLGWMGVVLDARIYRGLGLLSGLALWGALWQLGERVRRDLLPRHRDGLVLLGAAVLLTTSAYLWYNLTFIQHQGRYLFPVLPALALGAAVGLRRLTEKRLAIITALLLLLFLLALAGIGLLRSDLPLWTLALVGSALLILFGAGLTPPRFKVVWGGLLLAALFTLDLWVLFGFVVPQLAR